MEELKTKVQETIVDKKWCVYIHINKINGKKYIGQTCQDLDDRWKNGNGYQRNPYFWNAIKKYGWDSFEHKVLSSNLTLEEANTIEEYYISLFDTTNKEYGYNMQSGGKNKLHIQATKEKIRSAHLGKVVSEETRIKISQANSGENHPFYGTHRTEETKKKIGSAQIGNKNHMYGTHHSDEWKENVRQKLLGSKCYKAKIAIQLTKDLKFVKQWDCMAEAERELGITGIRAVCTGRHKTAGGFKWMFKDDYEKMIGERNEAISCNK